MNDNRDQAALVKPIEARPPVLDLSEIPAEVKAQAAAIAADVLAQGGTINAARALAAAYYFQRTGEIPGRHAYVGTTGRVAGRVLEGYRGIARELDMSRYQWRYRPLTEGERQLHEIESGWQALICEVDVLETRRRCIEMGIPYHPVCGLGIVKPADKTTADGKRKDPPAGKTWYWVLQKRARKDALRQLGENTDADEVLEEATASGIRVDLPPDARPTQAQAETLVRQAAQLAARPPLSDAEAQAALKRNTATMRLPANFQGFGDEEDPGPPAPPEAPAPAAAAPPSAPAPSDTSPADEPDADCASLPSASPRPASPQTPATKTNGRADKPAFNTAAVTGPVFEKWWHWADDFAVRFPHYQKDGKPDRLHILAAVFALGHKTVAADNLAQVQLELEDRARQKGAA
jgi:hypothetical protein